MSPGCQTALCGSSGSTSGLVRRWARPPQSMHVMTRSGSITYPVWRLAAAQGDGPVPLVGHDPAMPENRQILIASLPTGALSAENYELRTSDVPTPGDGEVLARTLAITIGAGQRAGLQGSASYAGAPTTGVVMGGSGVGRVEQSNIDGIGVGDLVVGMTGWQDYAVLPARDARVVDPRIDVALHLSLL